MISKKKRVERFYLDKFLDSAGKVPDKVLCGESPDFVLVFQQKKIGVEETEFHCDSKGKKGSYRRAVEENWVFLQTTIMEKVEKRNELKDTSGLLFFKRRELPPTRQYGRFADELVKLSREMINSGCKRIAPGGGYPLLHKYLKKFHLKKCGCYITWEWNHNVSSIGLTETALIDAAEPKIEKLASYRGTSVEEMWLLIVSGYRLSQAFGIHLSQRLDTFNRLNNLLAKSGFNRVYLYHYLFDAIYEWPGWVRIGKESLA